MRIKGFELRRISLPLVSPFETSFGVQTNKDALLVRVVTDDAEGWGECVAMEEPLYSPEFVDGAADVLRRFVLPRIAAGGCTGGAMVSPLLTALKGHPMAKAAVEMAVLDAELRAAGQSFGAHLGAVRTSVPSGVSVGIMASIGELLDQVGRYLDAGYLRIKLKIKPGWDIEPVRAVRERFGDEILLQVDANTAYTLGDARQLARLDPFDLLLIEQPLAEDDVRGHAELARRIRTPVCLDESIISARAAADAIALGACAIVNIKAGRVGGYLEARRVHDVCAAHGVPVWCGGMLETGLGRAANVALAALPGFSLPGDTSGSDRYFETDITAPFVLCDGHLAVPTAPGLGVEPIGDVLKQVTTSTEWIPVSGSVRPAERRDGGRGDGGLAVERRAASENPRAEAGIGRPGSLGSGDLRRRLEELISRYGVPGASIAVLAGGQVAAAAAGTLNADTEVAATEDSLFQIGSITKIYTTTLVMQLVDEGRVDLDEPVVTYLPELQLGDAEVTAAVTLRHLLTHTSGISGDHFPDLGGGDDVVASYVASCVELGQTHRIGATMSYCNSGFVIAGRVIERLTGTSWDEAVATRIVTPLGLSHTVTQPEDVLRFRSAIGHAEQDGQLRVVPRWGLPRSCGPAGLICATAGDVAAFARMHLEGGRAPAGTQVLSEASVAAMQVPQVAVPDAHTMGTHFGLGWMLFDWGGRRVFGHDGGTIGQTSFLRVVPDAQVAIVLLTNSTRSQDLYQTLFRSLVLELAGVTMPHRPEPPADPVDVPLDPYVGVYERLANRIEIEPRDGHLVGRVILTGPLAKFAADPVTELELTAVGPDLFVTRRPGEESWLPLVFYRLDDGSSYLHFSGRATPKVS
ncbi:MAG TPA: o-succinylbenzoate synthase [Acidimicrobiales bacterium]|nr:o-succinylbenzoate synthase [Acidimicrobiales bacterium]